MLRLLRLSLLQMFLLVALVALVLAIFGVSQRRWSVNHTLPPLSLSPDGQSLAIGLSCRPLFARRHPVVIRDLTSSNVADQTYEHHDWCIEGVAYSPDGTKLYSVGDTTMRTWSTATGEQLERFDIGSDVSACLAVSPNGKLVASASDAEIQIINTKSKEATRLTTKQVSGLRFSPDGKHLVAGTWGGSIDVWSTEDWRLISTFKAPAHVAFLPDGSLVAPLYVPATKQEPFKINVAIYEIPTGNPRVIFPIKSYASVSSVATSRDGKYLAAAHGGDKDREKRAITIWDANSHKELKTWSVRKYHDRWVDEMVFSRDGETLYCASNNNTVTAQHWKRSQATSLYRSGKVFPWALTLIGGVTWGLAWWLARTRQTATALGSDWRTKGQGLHWRKNSISMNPPTN